MSGLPIANVFDRVKLARIADGLAVAVAVSLPWSTSATSILLVLWLLVLIPTLGWPDLRRELMTPAGGLPVLLCLLGALGMLWADVALIERWKGFESFLRLLAIPLLFVEFRRSDRGLRVFAGYLLSCILLLIASTVVSAIPPLSSALMHVDHVLVQNPATQSGEFVTCIFGLLYLAIDRVEQRRWWWLLGIIAATIGMLANIFFVATGRTALAVIPVLLAMLAVKKLSRRGAILMFAGAALVIVVGWFMSPYLRDRTKDIWTEVHQYETTNQRNSSGERLAFWKKSAEFVAAAPVIGHGTGSIHSLFKASIEGQTGAAASDTSNPHNQTFAVAIQLGLVGAVVLWAMWISHLLMFRNCDLVGWIGLVIVVQNVVGSLFNSHLFDFSQGWVYVLGVGVAGGMALRQRENVQLPPVKMKI